MNRLIIAAAGSGKTTHLIDQALSTDFPTLIVSYTIVNTEEIKNRIIKQKGYIPKHITICTWFSFLLKHGVKPYQNRMISFRSKGMLFVNNQSAFRFKTKAGVSVYYSEDDPKNHYFSTRQKVYSDKISKFVVKCDQKTGGKVTQRLSEIYKHIFIDEVQDLAGYDLDLVKCLLGTNINLTMVGDPRQVTYQTHLERKNTKYRNGLIADYIRHECGKNSCDIDESTLNKSHRCNQEICDFSSRLFPNFPIPTSEQLNTTAHDGIYLVRKERVPAYLNELRPIQLRFSKRTDVNEAFPTFNFGESKGLTFDRTLIYPTAQFLKWLKDKNEALNDQTRCKCYVALTRAKFSVGIVCDEEIEGYKIY